MPQWLKLIDGTAQRVGGWAGAITAVLAVSVAVMTWVTNSITALAAYGWGLPVLVATGVVLAVIFILSIAAIAWRFFNPLHSPSPMTVDPKSDDLRPDIGRLERKVDLLEANIKGLNQLHSELAKTHGDQSIEQQKKLTAIQIVVTALDQKLAIHETVVANGSRLLIKALRARDAMREILKPNDEIAMSLGKRLMSPESYSGDHSWLGDYHIWNEALRRVDGLMMTWAKAESGSYTSLFDFKVHHYERAPMPPENIKSDATIIPFKTVCQVQSSYANQRDGLFAFLHEMTIYPA